MIAKRATFALALALLLALWPRAVHAEHVPGHLVPLTFMLADVPAALDAEFLPIASVRPGPWTAHAAPGDANDGDGYVVPYGGQVVAVSYVLTAAAGAGSLTLAPVLDGYATDGLAAVVLSQTDGYARALPGTNPFAAGQHVGARLTTDGAWDGTTADLVVTVWVLLYLEGG